MTLRKNNKNQENIIVYLWVQGMCKTMTKLLGSGINKC